MNIKIPLKEGTITSLYTNCYYCNEEIRDEIARDHDQLNGEFIGYAHNKSNLQAKNFFVPMYAYYSSGYDNHLFITKLPEKIRMKVICKTDENYLSIDMGKNKALDMFHSLRFFR